MLFNAIEKSQFNLQKCLETLASKPCAEVVNLSYLSKMMFKLKNSTTVHYLNRLEILQVYLAKHHKLLSNQLSEVENHLKPYKFHLQVDKILQS